MLAKSSLSQNQEGMLELQQEVARLQALLEAARQVNATIEMPEILSRCLRQAVFELEAEGAFFTPSDQLPVPCPMTYGVVPSDWNASRTQGSWASCPSVPLLLKSGLEVTRLVILRPGRQLSLEELDFLEGLAYQTTLAIENAFQHARTVAFERVKQDLEAARAIQQSLLAAQMPERSGYSFARRAVTCYEVGGDYLDIVPIGKDEYVLAIADVAGKGLASALVAASFRSAFRAALTSGLPLAELASRLGDLHYREGEESRRRYVTAVFARLDLRENRVEILNAGHPPVLLSRCGQLHQQFEASGPPLGMLDGMTYSSESFCLQPGDSIFLFTDGLVEVFRGEEEFGLDRLASQFCEFSGLEAEHHLAKLYELIEQFSGHGGLMDDRTAMLVKFKGEVGR